MLSFLTFSHFHVHGSLKYPGFLPTGQPGFLKFIFQLVAGCNAGIFSMIALHFHLLLTTEYRIYLFFHVFS